MVLTRFVCRIQQFLSYTFSLTLVALVGLALAYYNRYPIVFDDSMGYFNTLKHGMVSHVRPSYYVDVFKYLVGSHPLSWIALQSIFQSLALHLVWRLFPSKLYDSTIHRTLILSVLVVLTPLGFESSYLMPDFSGGLMLVTAAATIAFWTRVRFLTRFLLTFLTVLLLSFHISNIPLLVAVLISATCLMLLYAKTYEQHWGALIVLLVLALGLVVSLRMRNTRELQISSPAPVGKLFAFARFYELGPVKRYLQEECAHERVPPSLEYFCKANSRLPDTWDAQLLLWHGESPFAVFRETSERSYLSWRELLRKAPPILNSTCRRYPVECVLAFVRGGWDQFWRISLSDAFGFGREPLHMHHHLLESVFQESEVARFRGTKQYRREFPTKEFTALYKVQYYAGLLLLSLALLKIFRVSDELYLFSFLLMLGLVSNALICGGLSGLDGRYQLRVAWIPLCISVLMLLHLRDHSNSTSVLKKLEKSDD